MSENSAKDKDRLAAFENELAADPRSLAFVALAEEHNRLGNFDEAVSVSQKGLVYHPDSVAGRLALAMAESGRNNVKQALEQLKRALLIDQDNPKALAMMGRILLQKGLAKRAVQFLSVAVKLDPNEPEYADLLKRAKKNAEDEGPPVFRADAVKDSTSPWSSDESEASEDETRRPDAEHTVFDPEALKKLRQRDHAKKDPPARRDNGHGEGERLDEALAGLGSSAVGDDEEADAEPTRFDGRARKNTVTASPSELPPPRRVELGEGFEKGQEPTAFDGGSILKKRPKVGGSAAEFSRMMKSAKDGSAVSVPQAPSTRNNGAADDLSLGSSPPPASGNEPETAYLRPRTTYPPPPPPADQKRPVETPVEDDEASEEATKDEARVPELRARAAAISESDAKASAEVPAPSAPAASPVPSPKTSAKQVSDSAKSKIAKAPSKSAEVPPASPAPAAASATPAPAKAPSKAETPAPAASSKPEPDKAIGPASTRMVDEALWALLGGKTPGSEPKGVVVNDHDAKKADKKSAPAAAAPAAAAAAAPKKEKKKDDEEEGGKAKAGPGQMVVRTSERFGTWLRVSVVLVLAGTLLWVGYATAVALSGPPPEISSEEVKGIASDLERGGLASLVTAEEKAQVLAPTVPQLTELLDGVLAEIYARRWSQFGRDPEMKKKAEEKLQALAQATPTVELISAKVALSTSAAERAALDIDLENRLKEYPDSPKSWVLRARILAADGKSEAAEAALYKARGINPQHRQTLLELARWHGKQGAYGAAFNYFDQLQAAYAGDIEVAIERYVLGQLSGRDPSEVQATSALAGLVREELVDVADDEVGRASLAFAVSRFSKGDLPGGLEDLAKAELSYKQSAEFKVTVAGVLLSAGEWDRARKEYKEALDVDPNNDEARLGLARAAFGERAGLKADPDQVKKTKSPNAATAILPFGTVHFVAGKFSLVDVEPNREVFPEAAFASARRNAKGGPEMTKALEASSMVALAEAKSRAGAHDEALAILEEATKLADDAPARVAYGRIYLAKKDLPAAIKSFKQALQLDSRNVAARLGLAGALMQKNEPVEAVETLEPLEQGEIVVPQALLLLSRLRIKRGDYEGAARSLETLTELQPNDGAPYFDLGEAQHRLKRYDEALETYKKALKNSTKLPEKLTSVQALYVGRVELDRGNEKKALALLKQSASGDDAIEESHFYLGRVLIKKTKTKKQGKKELEIFRKLQPNSELASEAEKLLR